VAKNTSVIVKRLVTTATKSKFPTAVIEELPVGIANGLSSTNAPVAVGGKTEEERFALQQQQQSSQWGQSSFQAVRGRRGQPVKGSYICYRCGGSGHRIADCPTNGVSPPTVNPQPRSSRRRLFLLKRNSGSLSLVWPPHVLNHPCRPCGTSYLMIIKICFKTSLITLMINMILKIAPSPPILVTRKADRL